MEWKYNGIDDQEWKAFNINIPRIFCTGNAKFRPILANYGFFILDFWFTLTGLNNAVVPQQNTSLNNITFSTIYSKHNDVDYHIVGQHKPWNVIDE